jgi:hypothetical protein
MALRSGGLRFDGVDDYVEVNDAPSIRIGTDDFEIEFGFEIKDKTSKSLFILGKNGGGTTSSYEVYMSTSTGYFVSRVNGYSVTSNTGYNDGSFHTAKLVVKNGIAQYYVDDVKSGNEVNVGSYNINNPSNLFIGKRSIGNHWIGKIHFLKICKGNSLVLDLPLDEYEGTTANDTSGNGNHGTIYGAEWAIKKAERVLASNVVNPSERVLTADR